MKVQLIAAKIGGMSVSVACAAALVGCGRPAEAPAPAPHVAKERPALPVKVTHQKSLPGIGIVLVIQNESASPLRIKLRMTNPAERKSKDLTPFEIGPGKIHTIDVWDGWQVARGDTALLYSPGFKDLRVLIPGRE